MTRMRFGVLGVGRLGSVHARVVDELPAAELVGVHDRNGDRAAEVAAARGCRAYTTASELLAEVDAVVVAVTTSEHHGATLAALEHGCHVLVEKPLTPTLAEADELIARATAVGRVLAVGHVERFNPVIRACEELLDDPRFITCLRLARFQPRGTDVSVALDLMIHDIDLVLGLVDSPVDRVEAIGVSLLTDRVDMANARLTFTNGAVADISASRASLLPARELRVFQPSGYLSLDLAEGSGEFLRRRPIAAMAAAGSRAGSPAGSPAGSGAGAGAGFPTAPGREDLVERRAVVGDGAEPLRAELEAFVAAIRGEPSRIVRGEEGRAALDVALQIQTAIEAADHAVA
ncbi:MAG: Gfo/Idh/MocA family protein [Gemmatimonadota bacterium]